MKKIILIAAVLTALASATCRTASAQSFKDLLNKGKDLLGNEQVQDVISGVAEGLGADILQADICGSWQYKGAAVKFTSDNLLAGAASTLASSQIEEKLDEYLQKIGLKEGAFSYTFNADSTFTNTFLKQQLKGNWSVTSGEDGKTIGLKYGRSEKFDLFTLKATVSIGTEKTEFLFNADKILEFIGKISSTSDNSMLKSLSQLTSQFDGLKIGFEMAKVQ